RWQTEEAYAYMNLGSLYSGQRLHRKARENFELAISLFEVLSAEFPDNMEYRTELANGYSWLGGELLEFRELTAAIDVFERHISMLNILDTGNQNKMLMAQIAEGTHFLADLYLMTADFSRADEVIGRGKSLYFELTTLDPENMIWQRGNAMSYLFEARLNYARSDLSSAVESIEYASKIMADVAARTDIESFRLRDMAIVSNDHARIRLANNMIDAAESGVQDTIRLLGGDESYELARAHLLMGLIYDRRLDRTHAVAAWQTAISIASELAESSNRLENVALLAELYSYTGQNDKANALVTKLRESDYKNIVIEQRPL
ncbi:MAG: hypothetical protein O7H39_00490, partial [Gammaproteobacteria bacterium]|nr:hypothetical protein [Gammaproteobacteria bacterium]